MTTDTPQATPIEEVFEGLIEDITSSLANLNPEDKVYRCADGSVIKIKAILEADDMSTPSNPGQHGNLARVSLTGSMCNSAGKALIRDGQAVVWILNQTHHFKAEGDDSPLQHLEAARRRCVAQTLRAEKHYQLLHGYQEGIPSLGLATRAQFTERKLAEGK